MKRLTSDQSKIDLVAKLVKEGAIDFNEAIHLLEVEIEKEYITVPYYDWQKPLTPLTPYWPYPTFTTTGELTITNDNN